MIPLQYVQSRNVQTAVDQTTKFLAKTVMSFEQTMQHLLTIERRENDEQAKDIDDFVKGCQFYCSGNLIWRYSQPMEKSLESRDLILTSVDTTALPLVGTAYTNMIWQREFVSCCNG